MSFLSSFGPKLSSALNRAFSEAFNFLHWSLGNLRRLRSYVRKTWPGADPLPLSKKYAVYVHFDRQGVIHSYVIKQLEALTEAGFRTIFVSNSPQFPSRSVAEVMPYCRQIMWRSNVGYDFGAYKDGIFASGDLVNTDQLLLMNDSTYGPLFPLTDLLAKIDSSEVDTWGITDSWQHHYHIQSYFIVFLKAAICSNAFAKFWRKLPYVNWKPYVIRNGEIELTQVLVRQKLRVKVLAPYWDVAKLTLKKLQVRSKTLPKVHHEFLDRLQDLLVRGVPLNPSHVFWETLLLDYNCPFLKREVITINPMGVPLIWRWDDVISEVSTYDLTMIRRHLQAL